MKLLSTFLVLAVISTAGAAFALTFNHPDSPNGGTNGHICTMSGYLMYCS